VDEGIRYTEREVLIPLSPHVMAWVLVDTGGGTHYVGPHPAVALRCMLISVSGPGPDEMGGLDVPDPPDVQRMHYLVPAANPPGGGGWCAMRNLAFSEKMAVAEAARRNAGR